MLYGEFLRRNALRVPGKKALLMVDTGESRTYSQLHERAKRLANGLSGLAAHGDRVAILSENSLEYMEAYFGVPSAGMALTLLNFRLHPKEWAWILNDSGARVLLVQSRFAEAICDLRGELETVEHIVVIDEPVAGLTRYEDLLAGASPAEPDARVTEDDVAWLVYTSGTTGFPKGARLTHRNLAAALVQSAVDYMPTVDTTFLNAMPLCHVAGYMVPANQFRGGTVLMMAGWDPEAWMRVVRDHRVTSGGFAPTMMAMLLAHPKIDDYDLSSLEWMGYGASKIPAEVLRRTIERFGPIVYAGMGMTEVSGNMLYLDKEAHRRAGAGEEHLLDAAGKPMSLVDTKIVREDGSEAGTGEVGEMVVRGDQVMTGYWNNPEATEKAFTGGWFHTGDLARVDDEGFIYIVDRLKDMIISGGENVYSSEVENALYAHPGVAEAAVIGLPDPVWGERVAAVVVAREGSEVTADDIVAQSKSRLASYKQPRSVFFVDAMPKTVSGKIRKNDLRDRFAGE